MDLDDITDLANSGLFLDFTRLVSSIALCRFSSQDRRGENDSVFGDDFNVHR